MTGRRIAALAALVAVAGATIRRAEADEPPAPHVELWTFGPGEDIFERYGHGSLCVFDEPGEDGRCYNYGTTDFRSPTDLVLKFLHNDAKFWVSVASSDGTLEAYQREDRSIWVQPLPLTDAEARTLAARLEDAARPENREYIYDHFADNCTTRLRDHIDAVTGGRLHAGEDIPYGPTWRDMVRAGFSAEPGLLALCELLLGRRLEQHPTRWQAMFHPDVLRLGVWERFGVKPELVAERHGPPLVGPPRAGRRLLVWVAVALAALAGLLVASGRRVPRRAGLVLLALVLGVLALVVDALCFYWRIVYLHGNEVALVLLPTDFALAFLAGRRLRVYLDARLALLGVCVLLVWAGVLVEPLGPAIVLAGLPLACVRAALSEGWAGPTWLSARRPA